MKALWLIALIPGLYVGSIILRTYLWSRIVGKFARYCESQMADRSKPKELAERNWIVMERLLKAYSRVAYRPWIRLGAYAKKLGVKIG